MTDVFQVQADIAGRVAQALNVALGVELLPRRLAELQPLSEIVDRITGGSGEAAQLVLVAVDLGVADVVAAQTLCISGE